uniref:Uncharacterized protein n=1 Tax=Meloidogyne incognita TaxID=6306 RepID=A0A914MB12_MELIC
MFVQDFLNWAKLHSIFAFIVPGFILPPRATEDFTVTILIHQLLFILIFMEIALIQTTLCGAYTYACIKVRTCTS